MDKNDKFDIFDLNEINILIDNVTKSRYKYINYGNLNELAIKVLQIPTQRSHPIISPNNQYTLSKDETIEIALDFFKSIDEEFFKRTQDIITGKDNNISFNCYESHLNSDNSYESRKMLEGTIIYKDNNIVINVPLSRSINDVYCVVHEISHMFDLPNKIDLSRVLCADINSECFERMLDSYFDEKKDVGSLLKQDLIVVRNDSLNKTYFSALDYTIKYAFFDYKNNNGIMNLNDVKKVMYHFRLPPNVVINYLRDNSQDINYSMRYLIGGLASEEYIMQYRQNPQDSINRLKKYITLIKDNKTKEALEELGIKMDITAYETEIQRMKYLLNDKKSSEFENIEK